MKLNVEYSQEKDIQTYVNLGFNFKALAHGRENPRENLIKRYEPELQEIVLKSETEEEFKEKIREYLDKYIEGNKDKVEKSIERLKKEWETVGPAIIKALENLYQKPFPFDEVTAYLTTNKIFPYSYKGRYFFCTVDFLYPQLMTAKHELNHFMFYYYYPELKEELGKEKYELLKESLTYFTNPEQRGKPNEKELREFYSSKIWKNIDDIVSEGAKLLSK